MTAAVGSGRNATWVKPASCAACSSLRKASTSEGARVSGSAPAARRRRAPPRHFVGLILQALQDDADQRADAEVGRPAVGAGEPELRQLLLYASRQPRFAAPPALALLPAVAAPAVRSERALPAVGLFVAGLQEGLDRGVARGPPAGAVQVDERRERAGLADGHDLDAVCVGDRHCAVAGAEVDPISERRSHRRTINVTANG